MSRDDPSSLSGRELEARLHHLQQRAFAIFEEAATAAETGGSDEAYGRAQRDTAPLIAEARLLADERVRRLRARARAWRLAAAAIAIVGALLVLWLIQRQAAVA